MPRRCCVPGCKSNYDSQKTYVSIFKFPKEPELKMKWISFISRKNWKPSVHSCVCSNHFQEKDVIRYDVFTRKDGTIGKNLLRYPKLSERAVPSIYHNLPSKPTVPASESPDEPHQNDTEEGFDDVLLIQCVKERPELYDTSNIRFMDIFHEMGVWNDIADELHQDDGSTCKARWANIRDNFRKSLRKSISKRSRGEKTIKHYKYADQLEFLKKYFDVEQTADNVGTRFILPEVEVKEEFDSSVQVDIQEPLSEDDDSQLPLYTIQKRRKTMQDTNDRMQCSANSSPRQSTQNFDIQHGENDEQVLDAKSQSVDTFLAALAPSLKTLSAINWHHAKTEIFAVVQKYELKTILGENSEKKT